MLTACEKWILFPFCLFFPWERATTDLLPPLGHVDITSLSSGVSEYAFTASATTREARTGISTHKGDAREGGPEIDSDDQLRLGGACGSHDCNICMMYVYDVLLRYLLATLEVGLIKDSCWGDNQLCFIPAGDFFFFSFSFLLLLSFRLLPRLLSVVVIVVVVVGRLVLRQWLVA